METDPSISHDTNVRHVAGQRPRERQTIRGIELINKYAAELHAENCKAIIQDVRR